LPILEGGRGGGDEKLVITHELGIIIIAIYAKESPGALKRSRTEIMRIINELAVGIDVRRPGVRQPTTGSYQKIN
jgi:hypothetical protein